MGVIDSFKKILGLGASSKSISPTSKMTLADLYKSKSRRPLDFSQEAPNINQYGMISDDVQMSLLDDILTIISRNSGCILTDRIISAIDDMAESWNISPRKVRHALQMRDGTVNGLISFCSPDSDEERKKYLFALVYFYKLTKGISSKEAFEWVKGTAEELGFSDSELKSYFEIVEIES